MCMGFAISVYTKYALNKGETLVFQYIQIWKHLLDLLGKTLGILFILFLCFITFCLDLC